MSDLRILVAGGEEDAPAGLRVASDRCELRYAATPGELAAGLPGSEILFVWEIDREALEAVWGTAGRLLWIHSSWAGVDGLLFPGLVESDVVLTNAAGVYDGAMAEYAVGLMLAFAKDLPRTLENQRERRWEHRETESLAGKRVVVIGVGPIGRAIGRAAHALGMRVAGVGRTAHPADEVFEEIAPMDRLGDLLAGADYVVDILPLTDGTRGAIGGEAFSRMGPRARFLNLGRGKTVDEDALVAALREGRIAGAALDVFEEEPLPADSPLWMMDNVIVSPHMSGDVRGWERAVADLFLDNLDRFLSGQPLLNVVDKRLGYPPST